MGAPQASAPVRGRVSRGALGPADDAGDLGVSQEQRCRRRPQRTVARLAQPMRLLLARPVAGQVAGEHLRVELRLSARHRDLELPQGAPPCRAAPRDRGSPRGGAPRPRQPWQSSRGSDTALPRKRAISRQAAWRQPRGKGSVHRTPGSSGPPRLRVRASAVASVAQGRDAAIRRARRRGRRRDRRRLPRSPRPRAARRPGSCHGAGLEAG